MPAHSTQAPSSASRMLLATMTLLLACAAVQAQTVPSSGPGIYTCTDARGRTITADRPIPDCLDREQRELGPQGLMRRKIEPTYSAREAAEREDRAREAAVQAARANDERRRERALLVRYPNAAAHDRERAEALVQIDSVINGAKKRLVELDEDRKAIDEELEFYKKEPNKAPGMLRRRLDDNTRSVGVQNRTLVEQEEEKKRVNQRFDDERARLKNFWAPAAAGGGGPSATAATAASR